MTDMRLPKLLWLWIPIIGITVQLFIEFTLPHDVLATMHNENGVIEIAQFFIILAAFFAAALCLISLKNNNFWLSLWIGIAALSCFYIAGEEVSWGQHFLNWTTPDYWSNINDQGETNLHNTSSWLDQKPRLVLEIGTIIGGLIIPFLLRFRPALLPQQFSIIYPSPALSITALIALFVNIADKASDVSGLYIFGRASEVEELYLFYFVLLYLIMLRQRIVQHQN